MLRYKKEEHVLRKVVFSVEEVVLGEFEGRMVWVGCSLSSFVLCELFYLCDSESDDEDILLLSLLDQGLTIVMQDQFAYLFGYADAFNVKRRRMAGGVCQTPQGSRSSQADLQRQRERTFGDRGSVSGVYSKEIASARIFGGGDERQALRCQPGGGVRRRLSQGEFV